MDKYHKNLTGSEKLMALMEGIARNKTVTQICEEMGITRPAYYKWRKKTMGALEGVLKNMKPGRPVKDRVEELEAANRHIREALEREKGLMKEMSRQEKQLLRKEKVLQMQRQIIQGRIRDGLLPADILSKKNIEYLLSLRNGLPEKNEK